MLEKLRKLDYRLGLVFTLGMFFVSLVIIANAYINTGDWVKRSVEMSSGSEITLKTENYIKSDDLEKYLKPLFPSATVRSVKSASENGLIIKTDTDANSSSVMDKLEEYGVKMIGEPSIKMTGPVLGSTFWSQAQLAIIVAFVLLAITVYVVYRNFILSFAMVFCAICDMAETIAIMNVLGIELSLASLASLLMMVGYSVDNDIVLATRTLKGDENVHDAIRSSIVTGLTMNSTALAALASILIFSPSSVLTEIASVLLIGLLFDVPNTWIQNVTFMRWQLHA